MKTCWFDCFAGASGDMILGAMVDAGLSIDTLRDQLQKLSLDGWSIRSEQAMKKGISGTRVIVEAVESSSHRHLPQIINIIESSRLDTRIQKTAKEVFHKLAEAEAKVHGTTVDKIHFHEVGAMDAIIDIVGAAIGIHELGIEDIRTSRVHIGTGFVECQHGRMPVPAPATLELLRGVPVYSEGIESELITPTGAAILKTVSSGFGPAPNMTIESSGYGAGSRELSIPNMLRLWIGHSEPQKPGSDEVILIETNVDNMSPELLAHAAESLKDEDVLDIYFNPIVMKKNRPAAILSLLIRPEAFDTVSKRLFEETSSMGFRYRRMNRKVLDREILSVRTDYGTIEVKVGSVGGQVLNVNPEYESARRAANQAKVSIEEVYDAAKAAAKESLRSKRNKKAAG